MYERAAGHPVYLRPTNKGLTVMSLDPRTNAMVAVGPTASSSLQVVPLTRDDVEAAARAFRAKVDSMARDSGEERYVIASIRAALAKGLALRDDLAFFHQEWRFPSSDRIDVLALDVHTGQLVVIEAKESEAEALRDRDDKGRTAAEEAAQYVAQLTAHAAECMPFFQPCFRDVAHLPVLRRRAACRSVTPASVEDLVPRRTSRAARCENRQCRCRHARGLATGAAPPAIGVARSARLSDRAPRRSPAQGAG